MLNLFDLVKSHWLKTLITTKDYREIVNLLAYEGHTETSVLQ